MSENPIELAKKCRRLANETTTKDVREMLLNLAEKYEEEASASNACDQPQSGEEDRKP